MEKYKLEYAENHIRELKKACDSYNLLLRVWLELGPNSKKLPEKLSRELDYFFEFDDSE